MYIKYFPIIVDRKHWSAFIFLSLATILPKISSATAVFDGVLDFDITLSYGNTGPFMDFGSSLSTYTLGVDGLSLSSSSINTFAGQSHTSSFSYNNNTTVVTNSFALSVLDSGDPNVFNETVQYAPITIDNTLNSAPVFVNFTDSLTDYSTGYDFSTPFSVVWAIYDFYNPAACGGIDQTACGIPNYNGALNFQHDGGGLFPLDNVSDINGIVNYSTPTPSSFTVAAGQEGIFDIEIIGANITIPEPPILALIISGLFGLLVITRKEYCRMA